MRTAYVAVLLPGVIDVVIEAGSVVVPVRREAMQIERVDGVEPLEAFGALEARRPLVQGDGRGRCGGGPLARSPAVFLVAPVRAIVAVDAGGARGARLVLDLHVVAVGVDFGLADVLRFDFCNNKGARYDPWIMFE